MTILTSSKSTGWHSSVDKGKRLYNEDTYCHGVLRLEGRNLPGGSSSTNSSTSSSTSSSISTDLLIAGCFDGHGGDLVSKHLAQHMASRISSQLQGKCISSKSQVAEALAAAFSGIDQELKLANKARLIGSTAVVALVTGSMIHVASCGDSRAVVCHGFEAFQPVEDHTPLREDERARIQKLGGHILHRNGVRVMGALAMSRAIGDHALRPYGVTADPDVAHYERREGDEYLVLASDGLWNVLTNQDVACIIQLMLSELTAVGLSRQQISAVLPKLLTRVAMQRGSTDNVTVITLDSKQHTCNTSNSRPVAPQEAADVCKNEPILGRVVVDAPQYFKDSSAADCSDKNSSNISKAALQQIRCIIQLVSSSKWDSSKTAEDIQAGRKVQELAAAAVSDLVSLVPSLRDDQLRGKAMPGPAVGIIQTGALLVRASDRLQEYVKSCSSVGHQQPADVGGLPDYHMGLTHTQNNNHQQQQITAQSAASLPALSPVGSALTSPFEIAQQQVTVPQAVALCKGQLVGSVGSDCSPFGLLCNISCDIISASSGGEPETGPLADGARKRRLVTTGSGEQPASAAAQLCTVAGAHSMMQPPTKMQRVCPASAEAVRAQSSDPVLRVVQPLGGWSHQESTWIAMRATA